MLIRLYGGDNAIGVKIHNGIARPPPIVIPRIGGVGAIDDAQWRTDNAPHLALRHANMNWTEQSLAPCHRIPKQKHRNADCHKNGDSDFYERVHVA